VSDHKAAHDVTDRTIAEEEIRRLNKELEREIARRKLAEKRNEFCSTLATTNFLDCLYVYRVRKYHCSVANIHSPL
jgi:hypothetical protein